MKKWAEMAGYHHRAWGSHSAMEQRGCLGHSSIPGWVSCVSPKTGLGSGIRHMSHTSACRKLCCNPSLPAASSTQDQSASQLGWMIRVETV